LRKEKAVNLVLALAAICALLVLAWCYVTAGLVGMLLAAFLVTFLVGVVAGARWRSL
jgi:hypothetical protein